MPGTLPIIYVRGFAGDTKGINEAVIDPLYGFNAGSTHVRVNGRGDAVFYQFESPVLRLIADHDYQLIVRGDQEGYLDSRADGDVEAATIWIHRFYDRSSSRWGNTPQEFSLEGAARDLLRLTEKVLARTGAPRVHLVAHSMGGLVARSMVQKIIPETYGAHGDGSPGPGGRRLAAEFVDRLFTYGTPHGGIEFDIGGGLLERLRDTFGIHGADIFGPRRMHQYLTPGAGLDAEPPDDWDPRVLPDDENFPLSRVFCLIGTNAGDYTVAAGWSARSVGPRSDGLVQIENALVSGPRTGAGTQRTADHAFVHRSHSGMLGMVNSEEGYHNLSRFLFGDVRVTGEVVGLELPDEEDLTWQAEARVSIRGLPTLMHERTAATCSPILLEHRRPEDPADRPVPVVTTYLSTREPRPAESPYMRFALTVRVLSLREEGGMFRFGDHIEQTTDFDDTLVVDVGVQGTSLVAWASWASEITVPLRDHQPEGDPLRDQEPTPGVWVREIPFPTSAAFLGSRAALRLTCTSHA